jgi:hypothetical protein
MKANPPETAPKDGTLFLADIGYAHYVMCCWNGSDNNWVYPVLQVGPYLGEWNDRYFETEHDNAGALMSWIELPILKRK